MLGTIFTPGRHKTQDKGRTKEGKGEKHIYPHQKHILESLTQGLIFDFSSPIRIYRPFSAHAMQYGVLMAHNLAANANASQLQQPQVNSNHYQTPTKHSTVHPEQVEYENSPFR